MFWLRFYMVSLLWWAILPWRYSKTVKFKWTWNVPLCCLCKNAELMGLMGNCLIHSPSDHPIPWRSSLPPRTTTWGHQSVKPTWCPASVWVLTHPQSHDSSSLTLIPLNSFYKTLILTFLIPSKSLFSQKMSPSPSSLKKIMLVDKMWASRTFRTSPCPSYVLRDPWYLSAWYFSSNLGSYW